MWKSLWLNHDSHIIIFQVASRIKGVPISLEIAKLSKKRWCFKTWGREKKKAKLMCRIHVYGYLINMGIDLSHHWHSNKLSYEIDVVDCLRRSGPSIATLKYKMSYTLHMEHCWETFFSSNNFTNLQQFCVPCSWW